MRKADIKENREKITRREFMGFFLFGGLLSLFSKRIKPVVNQSKKAMFWRKRDET